MLGMLRGRDAGGMLRGRDAGEAFGAWGSQRGMLRAWDAQREGCSGAGVLGASGYSKDSRRDVWRPGCSERGMLRDWDEGGNWD